MLSWCFIFTACTRLKQKMFAEITDINEDDDDDVELAPPITSPDKVFVSSPSGKFQVQKIKN